jgi:hypothetical protein
MLEDVSFPAPYYLGHYPMSGFGDRIKGFIIFRYVETDAHDHIQKRGSHWPIAKQESIETIGSEMRSSYEEIFIFGHISQGEVYA